MCCFDPFPPNFEIWVSSLSKTLSRPIFVWAMNQHPKVSYYAKKLRLNVVLKGDPFSQNKPM